MRQARPNFMVAIMVAFLLLPACDIGVSWSSGEKENARLIFESLDEARGAARAANELPHGWTPGGEATEPVTESLDNAIIKASQVRNAVLTKAHPNLGPRFRLEYLRALRELREYYQTGEMEGGEDPRDTLAEFTEWFYTHQHEFRWWRGHRQDLGLE